MKKLQIGFIAVLFNVMFVSAPAYAGAELLSVKTFNEMKKITHNLGDLDETLVVMDDDDTLTMMKCPDQNNLDTCQYLGGPAWYSWQDNLLSDNQNSDYLVANNSADLLGISALLLAVNYMNYTEKTVPSVLESLSKSGAKLLVLTARGSSNQSATANQFSNLKVTLDKDKKTETVSFTDLIDQNALLSKKSGLASIASPYRACGTSERPVTYQQGVMYVAGQNKGKMLKCLLESTDSSSIKNIVFIDDTLANVEDVYTAFEGGHKYKVKALHYTALQAHKRALTIGEKATDYQNNAKKRWLAIKHMFNKQLQAPAIP